MFYILGNPRSINEIKYLKYSINSSDRVKIPIAVIDDELFNYKDLLRDYGFSITHFEDINDIKIVEAYPIVICDIKGVGKFLNSKLEGAQLISEIKKMNLNVYFILRNVKRYQVWNG